MTETPENQPQDTVDEPAPPPEPVNCRWCGTWHEPVDTEDWFCEECQRWQDATTCPVCGQLARISLMPAEYQPAVAAEPKPKSKKGK